MTEVVANDKAGEVLVVCRRSGRVVLFHKDTHGRINRILLTKESCSLRMVCIRSVRS
jgi:hypothetical protein